MRYQRKGGTTKVGSTPKLKQKTELKSEALAMARFLYRVYKARNASGKVENGQKYANHQPIK